MRRVTRPARTRGGSQLNWFSYFHAFHAKELFGSLPERIPSRGESVVFDELGLDFFAAIQIDLFGLAMEIMEFPMA
jgi:hypothetical protein